jgi:hypothetical protein
VVKLYGGCCPIRSRPARNGGLRVDAPYGLGGSGQVEAAHKTGAVLPSSPMQDFRVHILAPHQWGTDRKELPTRVHMSDGRVTTVSCRRRDGRENLYDGVAPSGSISAIDVITPETGSVTVTVDDPGEVLSDFVVDLGSALPSHLRFA